MGMYIIVSVSLLRPRIEECEEDMEDASVEEEEVVCQIPMKRSRIS